MMCLSYLGGGIKAGKKACVWRRSDGCRDGPPDSCLCVGNHDIMHPALQLTARQLREFALLAQPSGFLSRLCGQGSCPGGKTVWRNICHHGARGLYHDRGTSSLLIDDSNVQVFRFLSR